jgi:YegS/Rv2252/BmrU family lipid kinase
MRLCLIANPVSGGDSKAQIAFATEWFQAQGASVEVLLTKSSGHARSLAAQVREKDFDRIVAAGGDGTLNEVINGLVPSAIPLAFLPLGTTNVFALEAGIPCHLESACQVALEGVPKQVALGVANNKRFLLMAGAGFDAAVVHNVNLAVKKRVGKLAYVLSALRTLFRAPLPHFEIIDCDGEKLTACQVLAGNARFYGGAFSFTPKASLFAPNIDLCIVQPMARIRFILTVAALSVGLTLPGVSRFSTTRIQLDGDGIPLQIDGDSCSSLPCTVGVTEGEIEIVFPK